MFVKHDNTVYMVRFDHTPYSQDNPNACRESITTIYKLYEENPQYYDRNIRYNGVLYPATVVAQGFSRTCPADAANFSKAYGRLSSLTRALRNAVEEHTFGADGAGAFKAFMSAYKENHPKGIDIARDLLKDKSYSDVRYLNSWY